MESLEIEFKYNIKLLLNSANTIAMSLLLFQPVSLRTGALSFDLNVTKKTIN